MALHDGKSSIKPFIITVSARALFDLEESHRVYQDQGLAAFGLYQREREHEPLKPGPIYPLVCKLLEFNKNLPEGVRPFEVVLLSRNSTDTAVRVLNSIDALGLPLIRAIFTGGEPSSTYIEAIGADLFLSSNPEEVSKVVNTTKVAGATVLATPGQMSVQPHPTQIRIAFDGDAVLFSDEAERVYGESGLDGFQEHEHKHAKTPLKPGPFRGMLEAIHAIQQAFPENQSPIRTLLITARSMPAHSRAINTLKSWGVTVDEAQFLGGRPKAPFLKAFRADLFFDDSPQNIEHAMDVVVSGHVPFGVRNEADSSGKKFSGSDEVATAVGTDAPAEQTRVAVRKAPRPRG